jgi:hypothetical protein
VYSATSEAETEMSVGPTDGVGGTNSTSRDEPTYPPGLIDEFSDHVKNSLRSGPTDTTKLPHYAFNEHSSTQMDAGGPSREVKVPPPTDMVPLGGRLLRGARGGPVLMLMQATRYIEFGVDGVDGRPDLSARHIQDGLDGFWGSDRLDIFDASKRQLTSLPLEKAGNGLWNIKDANGHIVGHLGLTQDNPPKIMAKISPEVLKQFPLPPTMDAPQQPETVGSDPTVKPDANPKAPTEQMTTDEARQVVQYRLNELEGLLAQGGDKSAPKPVPAQQTLPDIGSAPHQRRLPNQTCSNAQLDRLESEKDQACSSIPGKSCSPSKISQKKLDNYPCSDIRARITALQTCRDKRDEIQQKCFGGVPDVGHKQALDGLDNGINQCRALEQLNCAPGHPMANQ